MEQLVQAFLKWLEGAGFAGVRQMPEGIWPQLKGPVTAVGVEKAEAKDAGFYSYLGLMQADGKSVSLYGKRMEAEVSLEVVSPEALGAKVCAQKADELLTGLSGGVPGLTITELSAEKCRYVPDTNCYCCTVKAKVQAYLYALANEEETEFTDFMLKGDVQ